jgi:hypothetical protein
LACHGCAWLVGLGWARGLATRTVGKEIWGILLAPSCLPNSFGLRGYSSLLYVDCLRGFGWASADGKESWRILLAPLRSPNSFGLRGCSSALCVLACHGCAWLVGLGWTSSTKGSCGLGGKYGRQGRVEGKKGRQSDVCFRLVYRSFVDSLICLFVQIVARKTYLKTQETGRVEDR